MLKLLPYIQVVLSIILIAGILLQRSEASLGSSFGSDSAAGKRFMRRGAEKIVFNTTVIVALLFAISAFASLFVGR